MSITSLTPAFEPVRIGMIGVGRHARLILLPALALIPELRLCCVATAHAETARAAEERYRVRAYVGYEDLLVNPDIEAVLVVGAPHGPAMLAGLEAGLHVWCETPAVQDRETAAEVRNLAARVEKVVEVGSCLRHAPVYGAMKKLLDNWRQDSPGPRLFQVRYYPYVGHFYNLLLHYNSPIARVNAVKGALETLAFLEFENGDLGSIVSRRFNNDSVPFEEVSVTAEDGMLVASDGRRLCRYYTRDSRTGPQLDFQAADADLHEPTYSMPYGALNQLYMRGYVPELEHFARRVRQGVPPLCGIDDMEQTLLVRQAIDLSAASRQWEEVEK